MNYRRKIYRIQNNNPERIPPLPFQPGSDPVILKELTAHDSKRSVMQMEPNRIVSFKDYLKRHYGQPNIDLLRKMLIDGTLSLGSRSGPIQRIDEIAIEQINLYQKASTEIYADFILAAELTVEKHYLDFELAEKQACRFRIRTGANLKPSAFHINTFELAEVYFGAASDRERVLDEYLVPYTSTALMDSDAAAFLNRFYPQAMEAPCPIDGEVLAGRMGLKVKYCRLSPDGSIRGQVHFSPCTVAANDVPYCSNWVRIQANTILVDITTCIDENLDMRKELLNDAIVHECFHVYRHRLFHLGQQLCNCERYYLSCFGQVHPLTQNPNSNDCLVRPPLDWIEWQANRMTPRIRMPEAATDMKIREFYSLTNNRYPYATGEEITVAVIGALAEFFGVSRQCAKIRMCELGYTEAKGVLNFTNGAYTQNYSTASDILEKNQTFTIGIADSIALFTQDRAFREQIRSGRFQYIDGHFCLLDPQYVASRDGKLSLTVYAKSHMEECCLVFTVCRGTSHYDYRYGTLRKSTNASGGCSGYSCGVSPETDLLAEATRLSRILYSLPASPGETLKAHMTRLKITTEKLAEKSGLSERTIRRLRSAPTQHINRNVIFAVCIGLQLEPELQRDWLQKCGIMLRNNAEDVAYSLVLNSMYRQPITELNHYLAVCGVTPFGRDEDEW